MQSQNVDSSTEILHRNDAPLASTAVPGDAQENPVRVLLVDDDEDDYFITARLLSQAQRGTFQVEWATSQQGALEQVAQRSYDVFLIDYLLGANNGLELLQILLERGVQAPVILLTGQGDLQVDVEAMRRGAADYLVKGQITAPLLERSIRYALQRKQAEEQLRQAESRYRGIFQNAVEGIFQTTVDGRYLTANPALARIYGYDSPGELLAAVHDIENQLYVEPQRRKDFLEQMLRSGAVESFEAQVYRKDGRVIWIRENARAMRDADGKVLHFEGSVEDITERQWAQQALQRSKDELEARVAERTRELSDTNALLHLELEERRRIEEALRGARDEAEAANIAKSEFLSRMSHELRTPLNSILGFGQLLQRSSLDDRQRQRLDLIVSAGQHLLELINEVLDIARVEAGHLDLVMETVAVAETVDTVLSLMQPLAARHDVQLENAVPTQQWAVRADRQKLRQILLNLVSNAIKYNHPEGRVRLATSATAEMVSIMVEDTGPGIAREMLPRLFMPFDRLGVEQSTVEGTGLGLALSKPIAHAMGGRLEVHSVAGQGSTFSVILPRAASDIPGESPSDQSDGPAVPGSENASEFSVLYIEDNPANLNLIENIFHQENIRLITAMQGGMGLEMAREHCPDLILLDVHLPDMDGYEVMRRLQASPALSSIPVLALSADAMPSQQQQMMELGARHYMSKPIDVSEFLSVIHTLLRQKEGV